MGYGRKVPEGYLPVFSVNTIQEAKQIISGACSLGLDGEYYSDELAREQTMENLAKFSDKLQMVWNIMQKVKKGKGHG